MATFTLTVDMSNAAFEGSRADLARILRGVAGSVEHVSGPGRLYDVNGHVVGSWEIGGE